jgi:hypothetical protein
MDLTVRVLLTLALAFVIILALNVMDHQVLNALSVILFQIEAEEVLLMVHAEIVNKNILFKNFSE